MSWGISVEGVAKHYGGVRAVDGVTFTVDAGTVAGLMGPNGAGKTTLFNVITRVVPPTSGSVRLGEHLVTDMSMSQLTRLPVGRTFQTPRCFLSLSVLDNIAGAYASAREHFWGALTRRTSNASADLAVALLERVGLSSRMKERAANLSGGERRMLEIARQLARSPKILLLDEPTAGLDAAYQATLQELLRSLAEDGVTILLVEHNVEFLMSAAQKIHVMALGTLLTSGTPDAVRSDPAVMEAYFGKRGSQDAVPDRA